MPTRGTYQFSWRDGNRARLLIDGVQFFPVMFHAIAQARRFVALEMYLIESGQVATRMIDTLVAAAQRGVTVSALLDHYGSLALSEPDRERLRAGGVQLRYFNPLRFAQWRGSFYRDHRKLLVVDGAVAYVGGAGVTDEFDTVRGSIAWRETMAEIRGPVVADWCTLFATSWRTAGGAEFIHDISAQDAAGPQRARVVRNQARESWEINRSLLNQIRGAQTVVWLATAYFLPPWKLRRALRAAARAGVDVRLLLPGPVSDHPGVRHAGRRHYGGLLRHKVRIFEYQQRFMHQKLVICDGWVSIGSSNMDRWGARWNLEANQEIDDRGFAEETRAVLQADIMQSEEVTYADWCRRSWTRRALEWFWGKVDRLLLRLGR